MGKRKREEEFISSLVGLSPKAIFALAQVIGVKFSRIIITDRDGKDTGLTPLQLRDIYTKEELEALNYKVKMEQKTANEIIAELINGFSGLSFGQQKDILEALRKVQEDSFEEVDKKIKDAEKFYVDKLEEHLQGANTSSDMIKDIANQSPGANTSDDMISANEEVDGNGARAEN